MIIKRNYYKFMDVADNFTLALLFAILFHVVGLIIWNSLYNNIDNQPIIAKMVRVQLGGAVEPVKTIDNNIIRQNPAIQNIINERKKLAQQGLLTSIDEILQDGDVAYHYDKANNPDPKNSEAISEPEKQDENNNETQEIVEQLDDAIAQPQQKPTTDSNIDPSYYNKSQQDDDIARNNGHRWGKKQEEEQLRRYEQLISLSVRQQKIYPEHLKRLGLEGEGEIMIEVTRSGYVRHFQINKKTPHAELNNELYKIGDRLNFVPAVPPNYFPGEEIIIFRIPIKYYLEE